MADPAPADGRYGYIFSIQPFSVHDGPGCRTVLFFKGCPLSCRWCANPEGLVWWPQPLYYRSRCHDCRSCEQACRQRAIAWRDGQIHVRNQLCRSCQDMACVKACQAGAMEVCGRAYTVEEIGEILNRDRKYWDDEGGVTFSGGEPLHQAAFVARLGQWCAGQFIHTAIETSAHADGDQFMAAMEYIDFAFIDLKLMDSGRHQLYCGEDNLPVLANIARLAASSWPGRLVIRLPLVGGVNDDEENIEATVQFMQACQLTEINLLPYHRLGAGKWLQCGRSERPEGFYTVDRETTARISARFAAAGIRCYAGADTPF
ncbi:MAG: glycyl-radical enzyme activating protein [Negativicutes bacterium]|nr:glycyl-radical enzyme activating protein [Negativicutes bacterium]